MKRNIHDLVVDAKEEFRKFLETREVTVETLAEFLFRTGEHRLRIARVAVVMAAGFTEDLRWGFQYHMPTTRAVMDAFPAARKALARKAPVECFVHPPVLDGEELEASPLVVPILRR